ncbi:MAG TPA: UDP-N-acetylglucosamine 2-epimerase [Steroidobacteraceae bacterium]|jgi:UDP-hydrolysing UDP-N-acetyl-D-glucosamine 2-epimerase|nr:UDP-N-acetylglucosamine 2-epimerase [Steroidobacteraceae bacterium]
MTTRRIAVVTGSRAEYGALRWLLRDLQDDPRLQPQLIVTGAHLCPEFGLTVRDIEKDGFDIAETVECQLSSDSRAGMVKSLALGTMLMPDALRRLKPHVLVAVGDRYEILAAAQAAALLGIPIAHISGGEVTEGAVDDWIRHSITKASWWHFAAAEPYRRRIIQLGESPDRVFNVGDLALDSIRHVTLVEREALERELDLSLQAPVFLVTFHPATLGELSPRESFGRVLAALEQFPDARVVITKPNADAGGREMGALAERWSRQHSERSRCFSSLGQVHYLSVMKLASAVIGNTSSGIIEAPLLKVPTVNIGTRQSGRLKTSSIVDCAETTEATVAAISRVLSPQFRQTLPGTQSLYGQGNACVLIRDFLAAAVLPRTLAKGFHDL